MVADIEAAIYDAEADYRETGAAMLRVLLRLSKNFEDEACKVKEKFRSAKKEAKDSKDLVQTVLDAGALW